MDAYKSQQSLVVVDDIEDLIEFVSIGPRFSTPLLQAFRNFFKKAPPEGRRLVVLATTRNKRLMDQLGLAQHFRTQLHVPNIGNIEDLRAILQRSVALTDTDKEHVEEEVRRITARGNAFSIPVKTLQDLLEVAAQDPENVVLRFVDELQPYIISHDNGLVGPDDIITNMENI
jgi:vesicle-fusing ATPase